MVRRVQKMPTPAGIGAGQTASLTLPIGLTYHRLKIRMKVDVAGTPTDVADWNAVLGEVRLLVDGNETYQINAGDLAKLNAYYGHAPQPGVLNVFLSRPWMRTISGEDEPAYGTAAGVTSFAMEVDIKSGVTVSSLEIYAEQSAGTPWGPHIRLQKHVHTQGVIGQAEISDLPRGPWALMALHVTTADIGDIEVLTDNRKVRESDKAIRNDMHSIIERVEQAGMTHIDMLTENRLVEALPMNVADFRVRADFEATGNFALYSETLRSGL